MITEYVPGQKLAENEYLLKRCGGTGFMCKLTAKGELMKSFDEWRDEHTGSYPNRTVSKKVPIEVITETYRSGWKIHSWRFGKSQNWATMRHPLGFTVEIYLQQLLEVIKANDIVNGEIQGEFMWNHDHKLHKRPK